ncbi:MAG: ubiquinol oxidase subunit II, partial [Methylocystaceae bacterium]|nr:ubiquinol oxidase subunit II [Methylocystaceae bacterium]
QILINSIVIMLIIVVPTILATLVFGWWFRASNKRATYLPDWAHSGHIELIVWGIPLLVVLFLSGVIWIGSYELDPARPIASRGKPIEIQVVSLDWKWLFIYPEQGVASVNTLALPVDSTAHFSLTSGSVMNMFFVPQLGSMIATMNGMVTQLHLRADKIGDYYGQSAQFSGGGFSDMHFTLKALSPENFNNWIVQTRQSPLKLDDATYLSLAHKREASAPILYGSIDAELFEKIATRQLPIEQKAADPSASHAQKTE